MCVTRSFFFFFLILTFASVTIKNVKAQSGDVTINLRGFSGYKKYSQFHENFIMSKSKDALAALILYTKASPAEVLSYVSAEMHNFLILLHALMSEDVLATFFIKMSENWTRFPRDFDTWLESKFDFPPEQFYLAVETVAQGKVGVMPKYVALLMVQLSVKYKAFQTACGRSDAAVISWLLDSGLDVDFIKPDFLKEAFETSNVSIVKALLRGDVLKKMNVTDLQRKNPAIDSLFLTAVRENLFDATKRLISANMNVNEKGSDSMTALQIAVSNNNTDLIYLLIQNGAEMNIAAENGATLLHTAVAKGYIEVVEALVSLNISLETEDLAGERPLLVAAKRDQWLPITRYLVERGANLNIKSKQGDTLVHTAVLYGAWESLNYLIGRGAPFDDENNIEETPLYVAAKLHNVKAMDLLRVKGVDPFAPRWKGSSLLHLAAKNGHYSAAKSLLDYGLLVDVRGDRNATSLHWAVVGGHLELCDLFLSKGANANSRNLYGWTPLHEAALWKRLEVADLLLKYNANSTAPLSDNDQRSPLTIASVTNNSDMRSLMLVQQDQSFLEFEWRMNIPSTENLEFIPKGSLKSIYN